MRLTIRHETTYRYDSPVRYTIQQLRLTPAASGGQRIVQWRLSAPGKLTAARDAYGNDMHTLVLHQPHSEIRLLAEGEVETTPLVDGRLGETTHAVPVLSFASPTPLTARSEAIDALAGAAGVATVDDLLALAAAICDAVDYESGITAVTSTAAQALALGRGVCQDHAHLMLAVCRARGVPARYVSGYIDPGDVPHAASHAWVDVWVDGAGWVSIDVTHACFASGNYCRLAVGRDYESAAPVRGMRSGGATEALHVNVIVDAAPIDRQQ
ncbi:transglutaminase family protein [Pandoraea nosoerga]|uniref:Transglutaminase n=1 Tax=Pandoraea nosoerga TaxID=2508296 RepID=A0A5E4Y0T5_9BURK|nr:MULTISPECIES: transglutaminase family protein [Pandoraea]MBN4666506.1 transglutaminase family protein [Pandoraea nosoerga]MBN4677531.1 transglutaminase family protein [Pandoraea nosoerga]MBN4682351.1 transglutaminase family protein [Pandoraea nosoerga]MBN4745666.1 transglutaminase family protein [Pandoraea nosoerga]VVE42254.1 transglutaminase [Pandoraea nosoerga]